MPYISAIRIARARITSIATSEVEYKRNVHERVTLSGISSIYVGSLIRLDLRLGSDIPNIVRQYREVLQLILIETP